ncbi:MAG: GAF domain-containing protein [Bacteroidota bacterium]
MNSTQKQKRYQRIYEQLKALFSKSDDAMSRMATLVSLLHHKMDGFFWTGFYLLKDNELCVGPYQGSIACMKLEYQKGVCWAGILQRETIVVPDVHKFPGHIACDSRSNSEIVVPLFNKHQNIMGVLDVDSKNFSHFDEIDAEELSKIVQLIYF